jgi:uroporphyrinogen-III synthase
MDHHPLSGRRIVITRPAAQSRALIAQLQALGAEPLVCPAIEIAPLADYSALDAAIVGLAENDWLIVTSANGVHALLARMAELGADHTALQRIKIGAIGPATAQALAQYGLRAAFMPSAYVAEAILDEIGDVAGQCILLPRADIAREILAIGLRERGAQVDEIAAYRTVPGDGAAELATYIEAAAVDAITFTSSSTVRYTLDGLDQIGIERQKAVALLNQIAIVCIGPITAATARDEGLRVDAVAQQFTSDGLVAALVEWFSQPAATGKPPSLTKTTQE